MKRTWTTVTIVALTSCSRAAQVPTRAVRAVPSAQPATVASPPSPDASAPPREDAGLATCAPLAPGVGSLASHVVATSKWPLPIAALGDRLFVLAGNRVYDADDAFAPIPEATRGMRYGATAILGHWPSAAWALTDFSGGEAEYPAMQKHVDRWSGRRWEPSGSLSQPEAWGATPGGMLVVEVTSEFHAFGAARAPATITTTNSPPSALAVVGDSVLVGQAASEARVALVRTCAACAASAIDWLEEASPCGVLASDITIVEALAGAEGDRAAAVVRVQRGDTLLRFFVEGRASAGAWRASPLASTEAARAGDRAGRQRVGRARHAGARASPRWGARVGVSRLAAGGRERDREGEARRRAGLGRARRERRVGEPPARARRGSCDGCRRGPIVPSAYDERHAGTGRHAGSVRRVAAHRSAPSTTSAHALSPLAARRPGHQAHTAVASAG